MSFEKLSFDKLKSDRGKLFLVAGPCSAESPEQLMKTAQLLSASGINLFRAGVWKPRTRPDSFQGVGSVGLDWLRMVKKETGLDVCVEVANAVHVEECLKHQIHSVWIGARTTVNPFAVQEIADAMLGTQMKVLIKNPINPDLELWVGALERIYQAGIKNIIAVHRGFSSFGQKKYRNSPLWDIPIELKRRHPELLVLCDPSHISGNTELISQVSQTAVDLNFDGLMIETHYDPANALTDQQQQITPTQLKTLLDNLVIRDLTSDNSEFIYNIENLREEIDDVDCDILALLGKRMQVTRKIGKLKAKYNLKILQPTRWAKTIDNRKSVGKEHELSERFIFNMFQLIHLESIRQQRLIMENQSLTDVE